MANLYRFCKFWGIVRSVIQAGKSLEQNLHEFVVVSKRERKRKKERQREREKGRKEEGRKEQRKEAGERERKRGEKGEDEEAREGKTLLVIEANLNCASNSPKRG